MFSVSFRGLPMDPYVTPPDSPVDSLGRQATLLPLSFFSQFIWFTPSFSLLKYKSIIVHQPWFLRLVRHLYRLVCVVVDSSSAHVPFFFL